MPFERLCLAPLFGALSACNLFNAADSAINNGVQGATATHLAVITVLQSPPVPGLDGGPAVTTASIFFGNRPSETVLEPMPVDGATVTISDPDSSPVVATPAGDAGLYLASSLTSALSYHPNALYTFTLVDAAQASYQAEGSAPAPETVNQLATVFADDGGLPAPVVAQFPAGTAFTLTRSAAPDPSTGTLDIAFVAVLPVANGAASGQPTWTNAPQTPSDFLSLITDDSNWRTATVSIPGSAFPSTGYYLITLTAIRRGSVKGSNLFTGSAILLGAGTAGIVDAR